MTTVELTCAACGCAFSRRKTDHENGLKRGMTRFFCSRSCSATKRNVELPRDEFTGWPDTAAGNRRDEFTGLRWFMTRILRKDKYPVTVTLQDLKAQWDFQHGKCPYTGWDLELPAYHKIPKGSNPKRLFSANPRLASLDRIDSSRGYEPDNIQFVCIQANLAKGAWSDSRLLEFCGAVSSMVYGKSQSKT